MKQKLELAGCLAVMFLFASPAIIANPLASITIYVLAYLLLDQSGVTCHGNNSVNDI